MSCRPDPVPPAGFDILLGRLIVSPRGGSPHLLVEGCCPGCGHWHRHCWNVEYGLDGITHRAAHCDTPDAPLRGCGYYVALDPVLDRQHQQILARFPSP